MGWALLLAIIAIPVTEIVLFIQFSHWMGFFPTVLLAIAAGAIGLALLRRQGLSTLSRMQGQFHQNQPPVLEIFDGACLTIAGVLLLVPGFFSDFLAVLLLLPPVRRLLLIVLVSRLAARSAAASGPSPSGPSPSGSSPFGTTTILDVDYTVVNTDTPDAPSPKDPKALL
jgi:UPF0716 protein FxsA